MRSKQRHRARHEQQENSERWLLTYADLITLLLGLFVILYSMSKVDESKYSQLAQALGGLFGESTVLEGGNSVIPQQLAADDRQAIQSKVTSAMYEDVKNNLISLSQDERGVVVHIAEELLFASASATLKSSSMSSMDLLASVLKTIPNEIRVEGHTDDIPMKNAAFPSNWHLSIARAMNTGDYLMTRHGLPPQKVTIVGYAEYRPLVPNTSSENRAKNRRVDIVIVTSEQSPQAQ